MFEIEYEPFTAEVVATRAPLPVRIDTSAPETAELDPVSVSEPESVAKHPVTGAADALDDAEVVTPPTTAEFVTPTGVPGTEADECCPFPDGQTR